MSRLYAPAPSVRASRVPLYLRRANDEPQNPRRRRSDRIFSPSPSVRAPRTPIYLRGLGDAPTTADVVAQWHQQNVIPYAENCGDDASMIAQMNAGQISPAYIPGTGACAKADPTSSVNKLQLVQAGTGFALTGATLIGTLASVAWIPIVGPIIAAIVGLFEMIFAHHAKAVAAEQSTLCAAVPAANNYLDIIQSAVASGTVTPQAGIAALDSLVADFQSAVGSIMQRNATKDCNAACCMFSNLQAVAMWLKAQYQAMIDAPATPAPAPVSVSSSASAPGATPLATNSVPALSTPAAGASAPAGTAPGTAVPTSGIPTWAWLAAAGFAAYALLGAG